jgi:hypothetical protein
MSAGEYLRHDRLAELLTLKSVEGISRAERQELDRLSGQFADFDEEVLDRAAAALVLAGTPIDPMPPHLRDSLARAADEHFDRPRMAETAGRSRTRMASPTIAGWLAAAVALVLALGGWWRVAEISREAPEIAQRPATPAAEMERLAARPGSLTLEWNATDPPDPTVRASGGGLVWNPADQAGYMRFTGLSPNPASEFQYQLWIFDAKRDERYPVDGGVFDIPPGQAEVIIPVRARLPVAEPALFAVTVERPGGVVVSSRERIALLAKPET